MARTFEVNQMTISKAYSLLETQGVLERKRGKPMTVADTNTHRASAEKRLDLLRPALLDVVAQARQLAVPADEVLSELADLLEDDDER